MDLFITKSSFSFLIGIECSINPLWSRITITNVNMFLVNIIHSLYTFITGQIICITNFARFGRLTNIPKIKSTQNDEKMTHKIKSRWNFALLSFSISVDFSKVPWLSMVSYFLIWNPLQEHPNFYTDA